MKPRTQIILVFAILVSVAVLTSMKRGAITGRARNGSACCPLMAALNGGPIVATNQISATNATAQQVIAYYFHGTVRCETCLLIERLAKIVVERQFSAELTAQRLLFTSVNYEQPENAHFLTDYKLPCPSLVLARQQHGKDEKWKLLGDTWQLVHEPEKFNRYVEGEVKAFLNGTEQASTNEIQMPPAPTRP